MIDFSDRVVLPNKVLAKQLDDELVILDLQSESYFGLDDIGTTMWNELIGAESIQQAYDALLEQFDVEPERLRADLQDLLASLVEGNLVQIVRD